MLICICCVIFVTRFRVSFCIKLKKKDNKKKKILIKLAINKDQNHCYYMIFFENCSYQLARI